jgi:hypothetical protein
MWEKTFRAALVVVREVVRFDAVELLLAVELSTNALGNMKAR